MNFESAFFKVVCAFGFSFASIGFAEKGNTAMTITTGIASAVVLILFVREALK